MRPMLASLAAVVMLAAVAHAQPATSVRAGRRAPLPREEEIALARSAAPASVSDRARVLVLGDSGYVVAVPGESGVTCLVNRSWLHSLEPHCYDAEGAATIFAIEARRLTLRQQGKGEAEVARVVADEIAAGRLRLPRRPAMSYMMSAAQLLYDDDGKRVGPWRPHVMIYSPWLTGADVGFAAAPDMRVGMVSEEGTAEANIMLVMPAFVEVRRGPAVAPAR